MTLFQRNKTSFFVVYILIAFFCLSLLACTDSANPNNSSNDNQNLIVEPHHTQNNFSQYSTAKNHSFLSKNQDITNLQGKHISIDCWFEIPDDLPAELEVECGRWQARSESVSSQSSHTEFNLTFVVLRDSSPDHKKDPLFYLSGGPGSSTYLEIDNIDSWYYWAEIAKLSRDIVLVDQRGTGLSLPKFECDNYITFVRDTLKESLPIKEEYQQAYTAIESCLQQAKKKGFKQTDYSTSLSAVDMNNIATALGYTEWNIMGGSYGTRLGLEWMRQNPKQIRSAVLDSVYPLNKGTLEEWPKTIHNAFSYFWDRCVQSSNCSNTEENKSENIKSSQQLEKEFWQAVEKLDKYPQSVTIPLWYGDWPIDAMVNGHRFMSLVYQSLYDDNLQDDILQAINDMNVDAALLKTDAIKKLAENSINSELAAEFNVLTYFAIECRETPIPNKETYYQELNRYPLLKDYAEHAYAYDPCLLFDKREDIEAFRQPLESSVPTLILSGGYDPVTPTRWAKELETRLKNSIFWYLPDVGHGVVNSNVCVHQSLRAFLDEPNSFSVPNCQ
ncbi:MAG: alpha/beta fold hydrolase [Cellvibrionaceae bacterium]